MSRRAIVAIASMIVLVEAFLLFTDTGPNIGLVAVAVALAGLAIWFLKSLHLAVARPAPSPSAPELHTSFPDMRTARLRQALATGDPASSHANRVRRQLIAVVDDELAAVHDIDRVTEPERAHTVLGDDLDRFVNDTDAAAPLTVHNLARIVTLIERI